jgi:hypothetical protein
MAHTMTPWVILTAIIVCLLTSPAIAFSPYQAYFKYDGQVHILNQTYRTNIEIPMGSLQYYANNLSSEISIAINATKNQSNLIHTIEKHLG